MRVVNAQIPTNKRGILQYTKQKNTTNQQQKPESDETYFYSSQNSFRKTQK